MKLVKGLPTYRNFLEAQQQSTNTITKLSSGKKINTAADDAAGLSISQTMKAQIRGLKKADQNIQDGISLIQTTESALGQIQNPNLLRMRELVIQAASDTLSVEDRNIIQQELNQIRDSIDSIVDHTEFNTIPVLKPPIIFSPGGQTGKQVDIVFFIDDSGTMAEEINMVQNGISSFVSNLSQFGDVKVGTVSVSKNNIHLPLQSNSSVVIDFMAENHQAVSGSIDMYDKIMAFGPNGSQAGGMGYRSNSEKIIVLLTDTRDEVSTSYTSGDVGTYLIDEGIQSYLFGVDFGSQEDTNQFNQELAYSFVDKLFKPTTIAEITENITPRLANSIIEASNLQEDTQKPIILQVGPNAGQTITVNLFDNRTPSLHISDLSIETYEQTMDALKRIDTASSIISERRGIYGAYQNRLEHALNNVHTYEVNLTSALSRIEDADISKETLNLSKNQILLQSSQIMITQINQMNQGILQVLK